jgi:hypothetical protein
VLISLVHWIGEGARWQMVPAYILVVMLFTLSLAHLKWKREVALSLASKIGKAVGIVLGLLLLTVTAAIATILPVPHFPKPIGPYPVGTVCLQFLIPAPRVLRVWIRPGYPGYNIHTP